MLLTPWRDRRVWLAVAAALGKFHGSHLAGDGTAAGPFICNAVR